jgi:hypothetical protein
MARKPINPSVPPAPNGYVAIPGSERRPSKTARLLGPSDANEVFDVTIMIRRRLDGPSVPDHEYFLSTPPAQRQRMPEEEFAAKYGASQEDIDKVLAFARSHSLTIIETSGASRMVVVRGTVAQMSAAFSVELARYEHQVELGRQRRPQTETYRGRDGVVSVPSSLAGIVVGVFGLDNRRVGQSNGAEPPNTNPLWVPIVSKLYNYPTNSAAGQTIGIFSLTGYASSDITSYFTNLNAKYSGFTAPTITDILINGATNPGSDPVGETTQDIDIAASFAPGSAINVYITTGDQAGWVQAISRVAHPKAGDSAPSVLSSSWFIADGDDPAGRAASHGSPTIAFLQSVSAAFQDAAIQGVTVCIACGDRGTDSGVSDGQCHVQYPASDPWVLSIGGTTIGNVSGSSFDEYVWNDPGPDPFSATWGTTGGGVSAFFPLPSYQAVAGVPVSLNPPHNSGRGVPDVAGNANLVSGYSGIVLGGLTAVWPYDGTDPLPGSGTSASAPQWAGLIAVINAALGFNLGFVNPVLYALGSSYFRDIVPGAGPADNSNNGSPGYPAGPGWDACTGWGSPNGQALFAGLKSVYARNLYFIVDKSTFGADEVSDVIAHGGGLYSNAFWLVLEGFSINELGSLQPTLSGAFSTLTGVTVFMDAAGPAFEDPTDLYSPQRIRFPYDIIFNSTSLTADFPSAGGAPNVDVLDAKITLSGSSLANAALLELVAGADPYFSNVDPVTNQYFYLSQDLRVFTVAAGDTPLPGGPTATSDAYGTIQNILSFLNSSAAYTTPGPDPLNALPDQTGYETGDTSVTPLNPANQQNYNFAIARVRLQDAGGASAANVRVFFRLWVASSCDTDFQPTTTYPSTLGTSGPDLGLPVAPLPSGTGLVDPYGQTIQTIPFFATDVSGSHDYDGTNPNGNIRTISVPMGNDKTWAYFGCFLDVYNAMNQSKFPGTHHCIVAQIAYDQTPIANSGGVTLSPENSDKLAQRNLQITSSGNPGFPQSHRVPQAFDTRASQPPVAKGALQDYPDELMIDWGSVPLGSLASIYWPQVDAQDVLKLAAQRHSTHRLSAADAHTIRVRTTKGVTYIPIPFATATNFAGLFTVDLPNTIVVGQELNVQVRRVVSRRPDYRQTGVNAAAASGSATKGSGVNWRYVTGTFQVKIPVGDEPQLLRPEENTLAILKWRMEQYSPLYRWRPVLKRYIEYIEGRVRGFGGDPGKVKPSPTGLPPTPVPPAPDGERHHWKGKVSAVIYDRFGDFKGFDLETEHGGERRFHAVEHAIEDIVRLAWIERILIAVWAEHRESHRPASIELLRTPRRREE